MSENLSTSRKEKNEDEVTAGLNTEGLNKSPQEVSESDARKDSLQSIENLEMAGKSSTRSLEKKDELIIGLNTEGLNEIPHEVTEADASKDILQSFESFQIIEGLSTSMSNEKEDYENIADCRDDGMMVLPQEVFETDSKRDTIQSAENFEIDEVFSTSVLPEKKSDEFPADLNAEGLMELSQKISERDVGKDTLCSLENLEVFQKLSTSVLQETGDDEITTDLNAEELNQIPQETVEGDAKRNQLQSEENPEIAEKSLKDINFDGNPLIRPPQEVCKGKQLYTIVRYLESADERDGKILQKILKIISGNVSFENFEFFCQKLQFNNAEIKSLENNRSLVLEEKILQALESWKSENQALTPAEMIDQLIRVLTMTGMHYLTNKVKALKLYTQSLKF
ncbi:unnamed protein product [Caretta caretta]